MPTLNTHHSKFPACPLSGCSRTKTLRLRSLQRGMTLVEVTVVIAVLLGLISVLFVGARAYKAGADRASCIQNIATLQKSMRSYCNLSGNFPGDTVTDLKDQIIGPDKFVNELSPCSGGGSYSFSGDTVPATSALFMSCSIAEHVPSDPSGW